MEKVRGKQTSLFMWILVAGLLSQNLLIPVMSTTLEDQKHYYSPDPHAGTPPRGSHSSPPHGTSPPHGSGGVPPYHGTPPHGSGGNCPTPSTPPTGGGGYHSPPTSTPTISPPTTPTIDPGTPSGGGGYYHSPPTSTPSTPSTPTTISPPTTPIDPGTPSIPTPGLSFPSPPFAIDPNTPFIGTCNYWRTHPGVIWGLLGWWATLGGAFGVTSVSGVGANMNLQQALSNTRTDGIGALYREGTASLLNSMVNSRFPYTTKQVRDSFVTALSSNKAAATQAQLFKMANEGRLKPRA